MLSDDLNRYRNEYFWNDSRNRDLDDHVCQLIRHSVADSLILCHVMGYFEYDFIPQQYRHSETTGSDTDDLPLRFLSFAASGLPDKISEMTESPDSKPQQKLWLWVHVLQWMLVLADDVMPSHADLQQARTELNNLAQFARAHQLELPWFTCQCAKTRLYTWQLLLSAPDFGNQRQTLQQLGEMIDFGCGSDQGWLLDPLTQHPGFRTWLTETLIARSRNPQHGDAQTPGVMLSELITGGDTSVENLTARLQLVCALGIDLHRYQSMMIECLDLNLQWGIQCLLTLGFDINAPCPILEGQTLLYYAVVLQYIPAVALLIAHGANPDITSHSINNPGTARSLAEKSTSQALRQALHGEPTDTRAAYQFASQLRTAITIVDQAKLAVIADVYGGDMDALDELVDSVLPRLPSTSQEAIQAAWNRYHDLFDAMAMILLCRAAGYIDDFTDDGNLVLDQPLMVSGDIHIHGALMDGTSGEFILAGGSIEAQSLITEFDCVAGQDIRVHDFIWGNDNDHLLVAGNCIETPLLVLTDHGCFAPDIEAKQMLEDPEYDDLVTLFIEEVLSPETKSLDRGQLMECLLDGKEVLFR